MNNATFVDFRADVDLNKVPAGTRFTAVWRIKNSGDAPWGPGYRLVHINADEGSRLLGNPDSHPFAEVASRPTVQPRAEVDITLTFTAPEAISRRFFTDWRLQDPDGNLFGEILWLRLVTDRPREEPRGFLKSGSAFVDDHTIPDGTEIEERTEFTKQWVVSNSGQRKWSDGYRLVWVGGDGAMSGAFSAPVPETAPGEEVVLTVDMVAPDARSRPYVSMWRLHDDRNIPFGETFWVKIFATPREDGTSITSFSQNDSRWKQTPLGHGTRTIGQFGCLLSCYAMMLTGYGEDTDPVRLNEAIKALPQWGFSGSEVFFVAPAKVYDHLKFFGNHMPRPRTGAAAAAFDPHLVSRIDQMLATGQAVIAQVDNRPANAYNPGVEQHWVLIVQRRGDDYMVIDPLDGTRISLLARYGHQSRPQAPGEALKDAIKSALFYKSTTSSISFDAVSFADVDTDAGREDTTEIGPAEELIYTGPRWPFQRCLVGLHDRADRHPQPADHRIAAGRFESVKVQSGVSVAGMRGYDADFYLCRLFESFNGRDLPVEDFVQAVVPDIRPLVEAGVTYFEFHNEPNLTHEGLRSHGVNGSWEDGAGFARYFMRGRQLLKEHFPHIKVGFPGLSPGPDAEYQFGHDRGFRMNDATFLAGAAEALAAADFIGIHAYYVDMEELEQKALPYVREFRRRWPDQLLFVTEFSNPDPGITPPEKGRQAKRFYELCNEIPGLGAAYYYIVSGAGWDHQALRRDTDRFQVDATGMLDTMLG